MLVLSRKIDEGLLIGDNIMVKIVSIEKGNVKLGIEAPRTTTILRTELKEQIENANKAASQAIDDTLLAELRNFKK